MFTGLIDHQGIVVASAQASAEAFNRTADRLGPGERPIKLSLKTEFTDLTVGESIAVDGACLTVTAVSGSLFECELSPETLGKTIAATYRVGARVNLERALRVGDRIGGHWVTGHVDTRGTVLERNERDGFTTIRIGLPVAYSRFLTCTGCVGVNGVSLTVNERSEHDFAILLIPHTLAITNLQELAVGATVNLEFDSLSKLIVQELDRRLTERPL